MKFHHHILSLALISACLTSAAQAQSANSQDAYQGALVTVSAVGDMMLGSDYPDNQLPPQDGRRIFQYASEYIQAADIRFGNLEGTLYDGPPGKGAKAPGKNRYLFRSPTRYVNLLRDAGFNVVSLANNHTRDLGHEGLVTTKQTLDDARIQYSSKQGEVAEFQVQGARVALIATDYYDGARSVTRPESTFKEIEELSKTHDIVIVSAHVGAEGKNAAPLTFAKEIYLGENRGNPVAFAREAIRRGADLIIMHGPHVPRAMEVFEKRLIMYSLGNFATMRGMSVNGANGYAPLVRVQLKPDGEFFKGHIASFIQERPDVLRFDKQARAQQMIESLSNSQFTVTAPRFFPDGFFTSKP